MLNCSFECYSYTKKKCRVHWNSNLKELKKKSNDALRVWESYGTPNTGLIINKRTMSKKI